MTSLWGVVDDAAREARALMDSGLHRGAVGRAYYAIFTGARALITEQTGLPEGEVRRHAAVHKLFAEHLVHTDLLGAELACGLRQSFNQRAEADYHGSSIAEHEAREAPTLMEVFLSAAAQVRRTPRP